MRRHDFILFWVSGPGAGVFAWGNASGIPEEFEYPVDWSDPEGSTAPGQGMEVIVGDVFEVPFVTRDSLRQHPAFADFEIFTMPNAANVFRVTREQWEVIFDALAHAS